MATVHARNTLYTLHCTQERQATQALAHGQLPTLLLGFEPGRGRLLGSMRLHLLWEQAGSSMLRPGSLPSPCIHGGLSCMSGTYRRRAASWLPLCEYSTAQVAESGNVCGCAHTHACAHARVHA